MVALRAVNFSTAADQVAGVSWYVDFIVEVRTRGSPPVERGAHTTCPTTTALTHSAHGGVQTIASLRLKRSKLIGFYWLNEGVDRLDHPMVKAVAAHIHTKARTKADQISQGSGALILMWIPRCGPYHTRPSIMSYIPGHVSYHTRLSAHVNQRTPT